MPENSQGMFWLSGNIFIIGLAARLAGLRLQNARHASGLPSPDCGVRRPRVDVRTLAHARLSADGFVQNSTNNSNILPFRRHRRRSAQGACADKKHTRAMGSTTTRHRGLFQINLFLALFFVFPRIVSPRLPLFFS
jgi:hypothetical protein